MGLIWRKLLVLYLVLLGLILAYAKTLPQIPGVSIQVTLGPISETEYRELANKNRQQADLQKLFVQVKISDSKTMRERTIVLPDLTGPLKQLDDQRVIRQHAFEQNDVGKEEVAVAEQTVIFDARGLDDEKIRQLYASSVAYHVLRGSDGKRSTGSFSIAGLLHRVQAGADR